MQHAIREAIDLGAVYASATVASGVLPSIGEYPLFIIAQHTVTPDFILRIVAGFTAVIILGLTIDNHRSK